jgi:hypothetical protein
VEPDPSFSYRCRDSDLDTDVSTDSGFGSLYDAHSSTSSSSTYSPVTAFGAMEALELWEVGDFTADDIELLANVSQRITHPAEDLVIHRSGLNHSLCLSR